MKFSNYGEDINMESTLAIIKPDGVARGLTGEIIGRLEREGINIFALKMIWMTKEQAKGFYKVHAGKPFYESVTDFMSSGPCVVMVLEGKEVINSYRKLMGATDYKEAAKGTIRHDYATDIEKNVVHGSDSPQSAAFEIAYFFNELEIFKR
jgi:nucleoside-diphosphate kinase